MEFIIFTNTPWDAPPRSRHQLSQALSKNYKVTFVASNSFGTPSLKRFEVNENMGVIVPSFPVDRRLRYRTPLLNEAFQSWIFPKLRDLFKDKKELVVICTDFGAYNISKYFPNFIYYVSDDFVSNVKVPYPIKRYTIFTQGRLVKTAKMVVATAIKLVEDFKAINKNTHELPLGAPDFELGGPLEERLTDNRETKKIVLLGFIGKKKTPVSLLNSILEQEGYELFLIGPILDDILDQLLPKNKVHCLGVKTGEDLMDTLLEMDVAIAPYYMEDSNTGRTPNKMWQYLSVGLPAVVTNLPNIQHWNFPKGTVYKANNDREFLEMVIQAAEGDSPELKEQRRSIAKENSWNNRASKLVKLIRETMS
jgi:glycosyltransferase involved in cell wall biosynthesis